MNPEQPLEKERHGRARRPNRRDANYAGTDYQRERLRIAVVAQSLVVKSEGVEVVGRRLFVVECG